MKTVTEDGEIVDVLTHEVVARAPPFFKTPHNHDTDLEATACALTCTDPSRTQQQFVKDADINNILAKFMQTGELNVTGEPRYQDIDALLDLQDSIVTRHEVNQAWDALPAAVRNILKDPKTFTDYVTHCLQTGDLDPLRELGLATAEDRTPPTEAAPLPPKGEQKQEAPKPLPEPPKGA